MVIVVVLSVIALVAVAGFVASLRIRPGSPARTAAVGLLGIVVGATAILIVVGPSTVVGGANLVSYDTFYVQMVSESGDAVCLGRTQEASPDGEQVCAELAAPNQPDIGVGERVRVAIADLRPPSDMAVSGGLRVVHVEPLDQ